MELTMKEIAKKMKKEAAVLACSTVEQRNNALKQVMDSLLQNKERIFQANRRDMEEAEENHVPDAVLKRLKFDENKLQDVLHGTEQLIALPDPLGKISLKRELDRNLLLTRIACPIGVIGIIFEARPDAMVQISGLCLKSGNCAILKGGKETKHTNKILFETIHSAVVAAGLPEYCMFQATAHQEIDELLQCEKDVDLLIPRGSNEFVQYIMNHTKIPVMGHADGVCHIFVDRDCNREQVFPILLDAKKQYTAACNSVETILVHRDIAKQFLPEMKRQFDANGIAVCGTEEVNEIIPAELMEEDEFHREYLSLKVSVKIVADVEEAVQHINRFGSHHTDCILTENEKTAAVFLQKVDSAGVYQNCSTRFADGFRYGFGAEVGISTSKLHARGPVGLEGLVTYKYTLRGDGQTVGDYASGKKQFHYRNFPAD